MRKYVLCVEVSIMNESLDTTYSFNQQFPMPYQYEQFFLFLYYAIFLGAVHWYVYYKIRLSLWGRIIKQYITLTLLGNALQFIRSPKDYLDSRVTRMVGDYNGPFKHWIVKKPAPNVSSTKTPQTEVLKNSCEFLKNVVNDSILTAENKTNILNFAQRSYEGLAQAASTHCTASNFTEENNEGSCPSRGSSSNTNTFILNCLETLNEQNVKLINRLKNDAGTEQEFDLYSYVRPTSIVKTCRTAISHINQMYENTDFISPPGPSPDPDHLFQKIPKCRTVVDTLRRNIETQMPCIFKNRHHE